MRGVLSLVMAGLLVAGCGTDADPDPAATPGGQPPVVLVPGLGGSPSDLTLIANALEADGRETVTVDNEGGTADIRDQAVLLDAAARGTGADEVDVVGFSAGGLVARVWATGDGADVVRRAVTLGTPNHGTTPEALWVDDPADCTGACEQLLAGSDLLEELNADETPDGPEWVTIWSDSDGVVDPPESAQLDGALDVRVQDVCGEMTVQHLDLLGHPASALVVAVLDGAEAQTPETSACEAS